MSAQRSQNGAAESGQASDERDVALLIDYENLQVSLKRHFDLTTPKMSLIIQEAQDHGRLVLARAYAPWTSPDLSIDAENLYRQGIDLVYVPTRKNSADVRMAVDAVETCGQSSNIKTYVIVTGDGDLIHPITYLRQQGRTVVVIGVDAAMSRMLSAAADSVLLYERDLDPSVRRRAQTKVAQRSASTQEEQRDDHKTVLTPTSKDYPPAEEAFRMVQDALARRGNGEPVLFQELGHWLSQDHNLKPRVWYGVPFSTFLDAAQQHGNVAITTSGGNSYAALPATIATDETLLDDDISDENGGDDSDDGSTVRLESLRPEERRDLFNALRELGDSKRNSYLSFRLILNHLVSKSILPRLSEWQIRRLLNDLADRTPPVLVRGQKTGKTPGGRSYTFSTFSLTDDKDVLKEAEFGES
ncbi:MAG TPA: NYN domain-containing protein [Thermomicrobiales bacterium]|nr:NYN domain-containing protein [Thermomicrobiales bacterium]